MRVHEPFVLACKLESLAISINLLGTNPYHYPHSIMRQYLETFFERNLPPSLVTLELLEKQGELCDEIISSLHGSASGGRLPKLRRVRYQPNITYRERFEGYGGADGPKERFRAGLHARNELFRERFAAVGVDFACAPAPPEGLVSYHERDYKSPYLRD